LCRKPRYGRHQFGAMIMRRIASDILPCINAACILANKVLCRHSSVCGSCAACESAPGTLGITTVISCTRQRSHMSTKPSATVYSGPSTANNKRVTLRSIKKRYLEGSKLTMLTAYDYPSAVHVRSHHVPRACDFHGCLIIVI
jgi:hypothetical protein